MASPRRTACPTRSWPRCASSASSACRSRRNTAASASRWSRRRRSRSCTSPAFRSILGTNNGIGSQGLVIDGTAEQKARYLPRLASGEWIAAFALSEPDAGSDPGGMRTHAVQDGDEWVIDGVKNWITNAGVADRYTVFAATDPSARASQRVTAFSVPADAPGFSVASLEHKMGMRGSPTGQLVFEDVEVADEDVIGAVGDGFGIAMRTLDHSRLGIAAQGLGIAQGATDYAADYAKERRQFGQPIAEFQAIQFKIADMETGNCAGR
ncbi:MAG TPA: acyl-CoA dehydrogenase family protein, partial [Beijerinckiaceae bacterium]|nr:acyl-CoA dehydrogenase family protein [Beijerinckiaceae bacterium]